LQKEDQRFPFSRSLRVRDICFPPPVSLSINYFQEKNNGGSSPRDFFAFIISFLKLKKRFKKKKQKDERKKKNFIIQKINKKKQTPTLLGLKRLLLYRHNKHACWNKLTNLPSIKLRMLHCFHANRGFAQKEKNLSDWKICWITEVKQSEKTKGTNSFLSCKEFDLRLIITFIYQKKLKIAGEKPQKFYCQNKRSLKLETRRTLKLALRSYFTQGKKRD